MQSREISQESDGVLTGSREAERHKGRSLHPSFGWWPHEVIIKAFALILGCCQIASCPRIIAPVRKSTYSYRLGQSVQEALLVWTCVICATFAGHEAKSLMQKKRLDTGKNA